MGARQAPQSCLEDLLGDFPVLRLLSLSLWACLFLLFFVVWLSAFLRSVPLLLFVASCFFCFLLGCCCPLRCFIIVTCVVALLRRLHGPLSPLLASN